MKSMFFAILIALFATTQSVRANDIKILVIERSNGTYDVKTNVKFAWGENKFQNAVAFKTDYGTYLAVQSTKSPDETRVFFKEENGQTWKYVGTICDRVASVNIRPTENDWTLLITSGNCSHRYEKKLTPNGDIFVEVK